MVVYAQLYSVANCTRNATYTDMDIEERAANARLIAAAPELLEACVQLIFQLQYVAKDFHEHAAITEGRAAIAKATSPAPIVPPEFQPEPADYGQADPLAEALDACDGEIEEHAKKLDRLNGFAP